MDAAREFVSSLPEKVQKKITYNLLKVEGGEIDKELFKKLETHGIVKKTQKTPKKEIEKAEKLRIEYFNDKNK